MKAANALRLTALLAVLALLLIPGTGCTASETHKTVDSILITRQSTLHTPGTVTATVTDPAQVTAILSLLESLSYRQQQNPYDTANAQTVLTTDRITLHSGEAVVAEYDLKGGLYIRAGQEDPWKILSDETWVSMWEMLHRHAPFEEEAPPYGAALPNACTDITSAWVFTGTSAIYLTDEAQVSQLVSFLHSLQLRVPQSAEEAAPFYDGGTMECISLLSGSVAAENYYIYGHFVSPTPSGPSSIMTDECHTALRQLLDNFT